MPVYAVRFVSMRCTDSDEEPTPIDRDVLSFLAARELDEHLESYGVDWVDLSFTKRWTRKMHEPGWQVSFNCVARTADWKVFLGKQRGDLRFEHFQEQP